MPEGDRAPIVIKRVKKGGHDGHHGGAWKVAYADFVTAMMAFFLLLWLLQAASKEQKEDLIVKAASDPEYREELYKKYNL